MAEPIDPNEYSRRLVVLFAALVAALGWAGAFDADPVPFDTTSSIVALPALVGADDIEPTEPAEAMAFASDIDAVVEEVDEPPATAEEPASAEAEPAPEPEEAEPAPVVEFEAAPPEPIVPAMTDDVFEGEPEVDQEVEPVDGVVSAAEEPADFQNASVFEAPVAYAIYEDGFDSVDDWTLFEQIIEPRVECYSTGTADYQSVGAVDPWLELTANRGAEPLSNHPILGRRLDAEPVSGLHRLSVRARIEEGAGSSLQVGPEMSVQNTVRSDGGDPLTQTYGVQYEARPGTSHWNIWAAFGDEIGWRRVNTASLQEGEWYEIGLVFDAGTGEYHELSVDGPGGFTLQFDGVTSLWQDKSFDREAAWITLEAENLYTCDSPRTVVATVHYDDLLYERLG